MSKAIVKGSIKNQVVAKNHQISKKSTTAWCCKIEKNPFCAKLEEGENLFTGAQ
jgi:predicted nucleic acid binding AN1-type Zn finger protein